MRLILSFPVPRRWRGGAVPGPRVDGVGRTARPREGAEGHLRPAGAGGHTPTCARVEVTTETAPPTTENPARGENRLCLTQISGGRLWVTLEYKRREFPRLQKKMKSILLVFHQCLFLTASHPRLIIRPFRAQTPLAARARNSRSGGIQFRGRVAKPTAKDKPQHIFQRDKRGRAGTAVGFPVRASAAVAAAPYR